MTFALLSLRLVIWLAARPRAAAGLWFVLSALNFGLAFATLAIEGWSFGAAAQTFNGALCAAVAVYWYRHGRSTVVT